MANEEQSPLSNREKQGLRELLQYADRKQPYFWMPKTMEALRARGFAEQYTANRFGRDYHDAWRITDAGIAAIVALMEPR